MYAIILRGGRTDVEGAQLGVGILIAYAPFERPHCLLRPHRLRPYDVGNLKIEGNIFAVSH